MDNKNCPKCDAPRNPGPECNKCGVIYAKADEKKQKEERYNKMKVKPQLYSCPACGHQISKNAPFCPGCGEPLKMVTIQQGNTAVYLGLIGGILLGVGAFTPAISIPMFGTITFFKGGQGDGIAFLILSIMSGSLSISRKFRPLLWSGQAGLALIAFDFFDAIHRINTIKLKTTEDLAGNPFASIGTAMAESVQLQWGWAVVLLGIISIVAGGVIGLKNARA